MVGCQGRRLRRSSAEFPHNERVRCPCRDDGGGEIVRFFARLDLGHCVYNIDPPASPYAIMRRACPYRGENRGPGMDDRGELDIRSRN